MPGLAPAHGDRPARGADAIELEQMPADPDAKRVLQALRQRFQSAVVEFEEALACCADDVMVVPAVHHDVSRRQAGIDISGADDAELRKEVKRTEDARAPD